MATNNLSWFLRTKGFGILTEFWSLWFILFFETTFQNLWKEVIYGSQAICQIYWKSSLNAFQNMYIPHFLYNVLGVVIFKILYFRFEIYHARTLKMFSVCINKLRSRVFEDFWHPLPFVDKYISLYCIVNIFGNPPPPCFSTQRSLWMPILLVNDAQKFLNGQSKQSNLGHIFRTLLPNTPKQ